MNDTTQTPANFTSLEVKDWNWRVAGELHRHPRSEELFENLHKYFPELIDAIEYAPVDLKEKLGNYPEESAYRVLDILNFRYFHHHGYWVGNFQSGSCMPPLTYVFPNDQMYNIFCYYFELCRANSPLTFQVYKDWATKGFLDSDSLLTFTSIGRWER
ncbi:hypothetical protein [Glutamicibacter sp. NPDC087344]|uniref:hypothetical protein n=1 Tax=Glutamicibacter sp. NPDC087344 TaxID=3363994 RepID=UPI003824CBC6